MNYKTILVLTIIILCVAQLMNYLMKEFIFLLFLSKIFNTIYNKTEENINIMLEYFLIYCVSNICVIVDYVDFFHIGKLLLCYYILLLIYNNNARTQLYNIVLNNEKLKSYVSILNEYIIKFTIVLHNIVKKPMLIIKNLDNNLNFYDIITTLIKD